MFSYPAMCAGFHISYRKVFLGGDHSFSFIRPTFAEILGITKLLDAIMILVISRKCYYYLLVAECWAIPGVIGERACPFDKQNFLLQSFESALGSLMIPCMELKNFKAQQQRYPFRPLAENNISRTQHFRHSFQSPMP